jgi:hypothetical protein
MPQRGRRGEPPRATSSARAARQIIAQSVKRQRARGAGSGAGRGLCGLRVIVSSGNVGGEPPPDARELRAGR